VVAGDRLRLWFMQLGTDPKRFQPRGVLQVSTDGDTWQGPTRSLASGIVAWRVRRLAGRWALFGYRGGEKMYSAPPADPVVELRWSDDLERWSEPVDVLVGRTACELVELADGRLLGVSRNEGLSRRGGDLLVGPSLEDLAVTPIERKLDSPNLFMWHDEPYLFARRQPAFGGRYDHVPAWAPGSLAIRVDQAVWSLTRTRSALFRIDPDAPAVTWEPDLPSRSDTSFAAVGAEPDGSVLVADYTSPPPPPPPPVVT
jgi:hypothetical protein